LLFISLSFCNIPFLLSCIVCKEFVLEFLFLVDFFEVDKVGFFCGELIKSGDIVQERNTQENLHRKTKKGLKN
jgi:hypothetical protein